MEIIISNVESNMTDPSTQAQNASTEHSKSERVYQSLRRQIREMELPPGARLPKNDIANEFGVSRAPVSEAFARLADEGLIEVFPQSGSFVAPIRPEDIKESMLIRTGLEVEAVRRVTAEADPKLLELLDENLVAQEEAMKNNEMARLDDLDEIFHETILDAINSPRTQRLLDTCRALLDRPRFYTLQDAGRPYNTLTEHQLIVEAIRSGDVEFAGAAIRVHLNMVARAVESGLKRMEHMNEHATSSRKKA